MAGALLGAAAIASSGILVRLAGVSPETAAFFRCLYALPLLGLLAARERAPSPAHARRAGPGCTGGTDAREASRAVPLGPLAGLCFAADLVFWHHAIAAIGAGLATVLGNLQVLVVGVGAWVALGERPDARLLAAVPPALAGVALVSGVLEQGAYGRDPLAGTLYGLLASAAYAGFILVLRQSGVRGHGPARSLRDATAVAAAAIGAFGLATGTLDLRPAWPAHGWLALLALTSQVVGWLLIARSLPGLPAAVGSVLLLTQSAGAVVLARAILGEAPSVLQLAGVGLILAGAALAVRSSPGQRAAVRQEA